MGLLDSIFGTPEQNKTSRQTGTAQTQFAPGDEAAIRGQQGALAGQTGTFANLAQLLSQQAAGGAPTLQTGFSQFAPNLQGVQAPQFTQGLDAVSQAQLAAGQQALGAQTGAQQRNIAQQFRGQGGASKILQAQAAQRSALQANPLAAQAGAGQLQREIAQQGLIQQGQIAQGQQQLAGSGLLAQLQNFSNQAQLQQQGGQLAGAQGALQAGGAGLGAQQNLLAMLSQLGNLFGTRTTDQTVSDVTGRKPGAFEASLGFNPSDITSIPGKAAAKAVGGGK